MKQTRRFARSAIGAGLGLALVMGGASPAFAADVPTLPLGEYGASSYSDYTSSDGGSKGETKLYVTVKNDSLTAPENTKDAQLKVSIPVAIHYVADAEGNLIGPDDNTVKFVNHTKTGPVHISKIAVQNTTPAKIVLSDEVSANDEMSFTMKPVHGTMNGETFEIATDNDNQDFRVQGSVDELGNYVQGERSPNRINEWNIAKEGGALALNSLGGKIGGFNKLTSATDNQVGSIHWTVRAGTRAEADDHDQYVTVRFNANGGNAFGDAQVKEVRVKVADTTGAKPQNLDENLNKRLNEIAELEVRGNEAEGESSSTELVNVRWSTSPEETMNTYETLNGLGVTGRKLGGKVIELYAVYL